LGNQGPVPLDEMVAEELQFRDTQVTHLCHGTDLAGMAEYLTALPEHRLDVRALLEEAPPWTEHMHWALQQLAAYQRAGRCPLRESTAAAHAIGRPLYDYHRMAITRLYAPLRVHENPMFEAHPEWRCADFDGTPISRLSIAWPEVRRAFLDH